MGNMIGLSTTVDVTRKASVAPNIISPQEIGRKNGQGNEVNQINEIENLMDENTHKSL